MDLCCPGTKPKKVLSQQGQPNKRTPNFLGPEVKGHIFLPLGFDTE